MPIDPGELPRIDPREVINLSSADLTVEASGLKEKLGEKWDQGKEAAGEIGQKMVNKVDAISRRDFFKVIWLGLRIGFPVVLAILAFAKKEGIADAIEYLSSRFTVVEKKPIDPRITKAFGESYPEEARTQAIGQYSLYLLGSTDDNFDLTNIPEPEEKDNVVWYLTNQYGITWPFVTQERDKDKLDQDLFPIADRQVFIDIISEDLDLSAEQKTDLSLRYESLSSKKDPGAVLQWLKDLKSQGVTKITDEVIRYYTNPEGFVTGN